jgi:hypothetical protein
MDDALKNKALVQYQKNRIFWFGILAGMMSLIFITLILNYLNVFREPLLEDIAQVHKIFLMIAFVSAFLIIVLKRTLFLPSKVVAGIRKETKDIKQLDKEVLIRKIIFRIRKNQMFIWLLADLIMIAGFLNYIILIQFRTFLLYSVVALYSLFINYPKFSLLEDCYNYIEDFVNE